VWVRAETDEEIRAHAAALTGVAGEWSLFDETHGFHIDGVDAATAILPRGWETRLVAVANDQTENVATGVRFTGWCLDPHDLCVAKLCAHRDKDRAFVLALIRHGLVSPEGLLERLDAVHSDHSQQVEAARRWILEEGRRPTDIVPGLVVPDEFFEPLPSEELEAWEGR
jgi:hypothetical protein